MNSPACVVPSAEAAPLVVAVRIEEYMLDAESMWAGTDLRRESSA